jgi:peptidoglycan/LPS O-acetylase OafA/YrhL
MSVLLNHLQSAFHISLFGYQIVGGQVAVVAFFIISGFYMSLILNEKYNNIKNSYYLYISNRFLRIFPLYWLVLIITIPVISALGQIDIIRDSFNTPNIVFNIINFFQSIILNITLFITVNSFILIPKFYSNFYVATAWSLSVEFIFYLLAPFLVKGSTRKVLGILITSEIIRIYLTHITQIYPISATPFLFLPNLPFFLLGALSYRLYKKINQLKLKTNIYLIITVSMILLTLTFNFFPPVLFYTFKQYVFYTLIFLSVPFMFLFEKKVKLSKFLGDLSYPVYISHIITLDMLNFLMARFLSALWLVIVDIALVLFISYLLKKYISDPIDTYRSARVKVDNITSKLRPIKKSKLALRYAANKE